MKRLITALMVLLFSLGCASAESLREQVGAPATLRESWTSTAVPMLIQIDAAVEIPEVEQVYRVAVTRHEFTAAEMERIGSAVMGVPLSGLQYECVYSGWYEDWCCRAQSGDWRLQSEYSILKGRRLCDEVQIWRESDNLPMVGTSASLMHMRQAYENPYTPEAAQNMAGELVAAMAPGRAMTAWGTETCIPYWAGSSGSVEHETEFVQYPEAYVFCYTPVVGGVPELHTWEDSSMDEDNTYFPFLNDRIYIVITPDGPELVIWQAPEDYGEQTPCDLLPFEQIMNVARELLPLKQADVARRWGNQAGLIVDRVTLSYCRVRRRDAQDAYELVPVWDFFGKTAHLTDGELRGEWADGEIPSNSLLTINAIDGLVIDRSYGY